MFLVSALYDNPLYTNLIILHPDMDDGTFVDLSVHATKYQRVHVKHPQTQDIKYFNIIKDHTLTFRGGLRALRGVGPDDRVIYSDSEWTMGSTDRKSYSGNLLYLNGDLVVLFAHI